MRHDAAGDPDIAFGFGSDSLKYFGFSVEDHTFRAFMVALDLTTTDCHLNLLGEPKSQNISCNRSPGSAASIRFELSKI